MRATFRVLLFLAQPLVTAAPLAAQAEVALAAPYPLSPSPGDTRPAVRAIWGVRLTSDWPQYVSGAECVNGGSETLTGTLIRDAAGGFRGLLERSAVIRFCGQHGQAATACTLTLTSTGVVEAVAREQRDGAETWLALSWAAPEGGAEAQVTGSCPAAFQAAVERLYLSVGHTLEVPLTAGGGAQVVRLEDYGWIAELR
ncbi:MAG: hypothetical protein IPI38_09665 [Gemmatimonadetes bacterium]|nr:hypothetical protein [Gemmatimonadota bacterium]MBP9200554.1 hypothetical protein [Gemmatimonadales bacterium]MBK6781632.1 hypothetical protein [Gemmatimonadota bacterium]MBK7715677.1 hypothetical protein [Gemmatimonadota bacterium]MBK7925642.1 hypothetical protein [Gemmatimonadota bacterium]